MNKKFLTVGLAGALAVTAVVGGSLAYFTDTKEATNTFTVGNVAIELTEPGWEGNVQNVYPGEALVKDPTVTNSGNNPCFVRIKVEGLGQFGDKGDITYRTYDEESDTYIEGLGDGWSKGTDGCFYYNTVLNVGAQTAALFDQVVMPTGLTGDEEAVDPIVVTAEAVQSQGAEAAGVAVEDMTVADIEAWFDTCMDTGAAE